MPSFKGVFKELLPKKSERHAVLCLEKRACAIRFDDEGTGMLQESILVLALGRFPFVGKGTMFSL